MKRFGWPRPALLIGYVLAPQAETFFYQALQFNGWGFLIRPGVLIIGALTLASVYFGLKNRVDDTGPTGDAIGHLTQQPQSPDRIRAGDHGVLCRRALGCARVIRCWGRSFRLGLASIGVVFGVILLVHLWRGHEDHPAFFDYEIVGDHVGNEGNSWFWTGPAWIAALVAATAMVGFYISMIAFFVAFLRLRAGATWLMTAHPDRLCGGVHPGCWPICSA